VVIMVEGNASMYLGSPRMAEMVIGEKATLEEMGGARMHATVSGSGDNLAIDDADAIAQAKRYFSYMPQRWRDEPSAIEPGKPATTLDASVIPESERQGYDMHKVVDTLVDEGTFFEVKPLFAKELIVGFARLAGRSVGIVANNPAQKGGVLFVDSADNAVFANKIAEIADPDERERFVAERRAEYEIDVDLLHLASELVIDAVVPPEELRDELITRLELARTKDRDFSDRRHGVPPV